MYFHEQISKTEADIYFWQTYTGRYCQMIPAVPIPGIIAGTWLSPALSLNNFDIIIYLQYNTHTSDEQGYHLAT